MTFPAAPWDLRGQLWLTFFVAVGPGRPGGPYGVAFVSYEPGSELTYSKLLVARPVRRDGAARVEITDIWVDSPTSRDGGRALWAIPKELCGFASRRDDRSLLSRAEWSAHRDGQPIASARFADVSRAAVRLPFRGRTSQPDGSARVSAQLRGSARSLPCRARWEFEADGPLGWLRAGHQLGSMRMADFRLIFG
jgi:hypothetical protein